MKKMYSRIVALAAIVLMTSAPALAQQKVVRINTTVSALNLTQINDQTKNLSLSRYLMAGYNTICLPFDVNETSLKSAVGEGVMIEQLQKVDGNQLYFVDVTKDGIKAGEPYLIYSPKTFTAIFKCQDITTFTKETKAISFNGVSMQTTYVKANPVDCFGIPAQQDGDELQSILIRTVGDKCFLPTRCGITCSDKTMVPEIKHVTSITDATAINRLMAEDATVDVYNVNGTICKQNVSINSAMKTLPKGIYVVNGQKFMVK